MRWLKHAFAVDPPGPAEPTELQREVTDRVCREIVRRRLSTPAILFLEMFRPLNYLSSQMMHFFTPIAGVLLDPKGYQAFATFLGRRGSVDYLHQRIERFQQEADEQH